jgi:hypothetical protein
MKELDDMMNTSEIVLPTCTAALLEQEAEHHCQSTA